MDAEITRAIITVLLAGTVTWQVISHFMRKSRSRSWPVTIGTIETFEVRRVRRARLMTLHYCQLGHSYQVNGSYQASTLALPAADAEAAEELGKQLKSRTLEVRYNPNQPDDSLPAQSELDGRKIVLLCDDE